MSGHSKSSSGKTHTDPAGTQHWGRGNTISAQKFFTIAQVAEQQQVSHRTVQRWIASGLLIAHRIGAVVRIAEHDLLAFFAQHRGA
jgi:excisionase family DNA binding protein